MQTPKSHCNWRGMFQTNLFVSKNEDEKMLRDCFCTSVVCSWSALFGAIMRPGFDESDTRVVDVVNDAVAAFLTVA